MTFVLSGWMLYAMWAVLCLMGVDFLVGLFRTLRAGSFSTAFIPGYLQDFLRYIFPLFLIVNIMSLDSTGWLLLIAYYIGAIGVILKYLADIKSKL